MTGGYSDPKKPDRHHRIKKNYRSVLILDELLSLNDYELSRLKDDIKDIKALLDNSRYADMAASQQQRVMPKMKPVLPGTKLRKNELLKKIRKEIERMDKRTYRVYRSQFSKCRIILIQILLVIITVLVIIL
jgi:hypothetical protein